MLAYVYNTQQKYSWYVYVRAHTLSLCFKVQNKVWLRSKTPEGTLALWNKPPDKQLKTEMASLDNICISKWNKILRLKFNVHATDVLHSIWTTKQNMTVQSAKSHWIICRHKTKCKEVRYFFKS